MRTIRMAHLRHKSVNFAVFGVDAPSRSSEDRDELLVRLILAARSTGMRVDKAALACGSGSRAMFYGTPDLVRFLSQLGGVPRWTHTLLVS